MLVTKTLILPYGNNTPRVAADAFIAPSAQLIGDVQIGAQSSIWYGCILRGDVNRITIGDRTNLQDGTIVHVSPEVAPTVIGSDVLVGHGALLHGCELRDGSFVGMRATILNHAIVETGALVAAGALVTEGTLVPSGEMWGGMPARKLAALQPAAADAMRVAVQHYVLLGQQHALAVRQMNASDKAT
jgi:gamma-carbonic anhydrase